MTGWAVRVWFRCLYFLVLPVDGVWGGLRKWCWVPLWVSFDYGDLVTCLGSSGG